jgi:hypothetical protein
MNREDETGRTDTAEMNAGPEPGGRPETLPLCRRRRTRVAFLCAGFFVLGTGLGSLMTSKIIRHHVRRGFRDPDRIASHVLSRMRDDLDLTDEQAESILSVLKKHFNSIHDALCREHDAMNEEIGRFLDEEQLARHRELVAERRARFLGPHSGRRGGKR